MTGWSRESFESDHYSFESVFADLPPRKTDLDFPFDRAFPGIRTDFFDFWFNSCQMVGLEKKGDQEKEGRRYFTSSVDHPDWGRRKPRFPGSSPCCVPSFSPLRILIFMLPSLWISLVLGNFPSAQEDVVPENSEVKEKSELSSHAEGSKSRGRH